ncbi:MAG TPA: helix-turn-helix transcriptional regulator [Pseudonocardiaceae bacterium]|jgi:transcriptional regulator with XRE-family HTH domain|nr:helix-turn-helix transcriptional regulator [Pseudonocardiaceae bacterium]
MTTFTRPRTTLPTATNVGLPPTLPVSPSHEAPQSADVRRHALADFLRSRRERISPDQVGLPPGGRRRTPGLRREEVAQLAGVGVTWYTWLEQGRDIRASDQVLRAIANTLQLDPYECAHLFTLAGQPEPTVQKECRAISPAIQLMLRQLEPLPANIANARLDILAYNRAYDRMVGGLDRIPFEDRNSLWLCFTDPAWRSRLVEWDVAAPRLVAQFRAAMAGHVAESSWKCLVKRLREASPEFVAIWDQHEVKAPENLTKRYANSEVGLLELDYTHLWFGPRSEMRLTTYTPANDATRDRVERLYDLVLADDNA